MKKKKSVKAVNSIKIKKPFLTKIVVRVIVALILLITFAYAINYSVKRITKVTSEGKIALIDKQLSFCQELITVKYRYSDIVTLKKSAGFAKSYSIIKYSGVLRAGIADITDVFYEVTKDGKTIKLTVPEAELLGNEISNQEIFDEKQSVFVPITTQEIFNEIEEAKRQFSEDAIADGILQEAKNYAERIIRQMMLACGFENVIIK